MNVNSNGSRICLFISTIACMALPRFSNLAAQSLNPAQPRVNVTEIAPNVLVFATKTGNVLASVGPDGALLLGTPSAESTEQVSKMLANRTQSAFRYVVIWPEDPAHSEGDAGWQRRGAFVAIHENTIGHMSANSGKMMELPKGPQRFAELGVELPRITFSEVLAFNLNGDAIHVVHQKSGYSDGDALVHFHVDKVVYLGEDFPGDGYPLIDITQDGTLAGLLSTLEEVTPWVDASMHVVPARGEVTNGAGLQAFHDMIVTVRNRIEGLIKEGQTEEQIIAQHPTAEFDARWGQGRVTPAAFVKEVFATVVQKK
jgi:cyclase